MKLKYYLVVGMLCVVFTGCATVPITGRRQLSIISQSELLSLSANNYGEMIQGETLSTNAKETAMVRRVGERIAFATEAFLQENGLAHTITDYKWEFTTIAKDETVNASCMPGGKIVVYTGILPVAASDAGLAAILGHEVAHAIANHGGERVSQGLLFQMGSETLHQAMQKQPDKTRAIVLSAFGLGSQLGVLLPYSRLQENEADQIGLILMAKAGYNPRESIAFWQRMSRIGKRQPLEFLSTHPATESRIERIESLIPEALKYYKE